MAENIELKADQRVITGKKVKHLRKNGLIPIHLFGHNIDSMALQVSAVDLNKAISQAGKTRLINLSIGDSAKPRNVLMREVQKDAIKGNLIHVDFYEVNMAEEIRVEVPIFIVGESPALKTRDNMLYQTMDSLSIECLPDKMPDSIAVDISSIVEVDQAIHVKDIDLPDVTILNDPDLVIVKVSMRPVETVEGAEEEPTAEGAAPVEASGSEDKTATAES